jgi:hypothetical protein
VNARLKSQIVLLRGDGSLEPLPLRPPPFSPGFVVLAREKCLFERFDTAAGVSARAAAAAARLHAETAAPYQRYGVLITNKGRSFGIWWWDAQWAGEKLGGHGLDPQVKIVPEPMVRAAGDGWRIAKASSGYEAQLWKNGFLHADHWRRTAFDTPAWQDFVRVQSDQAGAEGAVLMAQEPPWTLSSPYRRMLISEWTNTRLAQAAVAAAVAAVFCLSLYFVGEGIGLKRDTAALKAQAAELQAQTPAGQSAQSQISGVMALKSAIEGPDPMVMLQNAQEIIEPFGHRVVSFDVNRQGVTIVLPRAAISDLEGISRELSASPYFASVEPTLGDNREQLTIVMAAKGVRPAAARPSASGTRPRIGANRL